jgi:hypothetical protein
LICHKSIIDRAEKAQRHFAAIRTGFAATG